MAVWVWIGLMALTGVVRAEPPGLAPPGWTRKETSDSVGYIAPGSGEFVQVSELRNAAGLDDALLSVASSISRIPRDKLSISSFGARAESYLRSSPTGDRCAAKP
jgi:hypothetical protein